MDEPLIALRNNLRALTAALEQIRDLRRYTIGQGILMDPVPDVFLKAQEVDPIVHEALARPGVPDVLKEELQGE